MRPLLAPAIRCFALILLALLLLSGCAQVLGPRTLLLRQDALQHKLAQLFPLQRNVLEVFKVTVDTPSVAMLPESQRVSTGLNVMVQDRLQGREYRGHLTASFGLRFDPEDSALRLTQVRIETLAIDGISDKAQKGVSLLAPWIAQEKLEGAVLYSLKAQDLARADQLGYSVGSIDITPEGVAIRLIAKP